MIWNLWARSRNVMLEGGEGGKASRGVGKCRLFFFLRLPVLKFASIRTKPSLGVKEDQRMLTVNPSL